MSTSAAMGNAWIRLMPGVFVLLWSTGFIGARFGLPYAEPFTFLSIRFLITLVVLYAIIRLMREVWPGTIRAWIHIGIAGVLVHGAYLGGVFSAIDQGMPAGVAALIVGLQPLVTAIVGFAWLGERITRYQWLGIMLGLVGITLVLSEQLDLGNAARLFSDFGFAAILAASLALLGISFGTLYQKRFCTTMPLTTGTFVQFLGATLVLGAGALLFETRQVEWSLTFILTLGWLVFVLSIAAILLLMALIRRGEASRVASLFYLVPPVTAVEAWILFGERLGPAALTGIVVAVIGVALAVRSGPEQPLQSQPDNHNDRR